MLKKRSLQEIHSSFFFFVFPGVLQWKAGWRREGKIGFFSVLRGVLGVELGVMGLWVGGEGGEDTIDGYTGH